MRSGLLRCVERSCTTANDCALKEGNWDQLKLESKDMLLLMGGLEGLKRLKANVDVMLELAMAAESWSREEAPIIGVWQRFGTKWAISRMARTPTF